MAKRISKKAGDKSIKGLVQALQSSGTGRPKLVVIATIAKKNEDASAEEFVHLLSQYGPPIGNGTLQKVRVYLDLAKPKKPRKMKDDLDDLLEDPMNPKD